MNRSHTCTPIFVVTHVYPQATVTIRATDRSTGHSTAGEGIDWGADNKRPHGDSKAPPYSVKAQLGLMRSAPAEVHCDQREVRVQQCSAVLAQPSLQKVAAFRPLPQNALLGTGVTPSN